MNDKSMRIFTRTCSLIFITLLLVTSACTSGRKAQSATNDIKLENKSTSSLIELMKKNEFTFQWMTAKMNVDAEINGNSNNLTVTMRCRKDSAIWLSISPALGIEVARLLVTKDSVKLRNSLNKTYFLGDYNYLSKMLNTELDYEMLQSLILGNSVAFYEEDEKLRSTKMDNKYVLSTVRKRQLRKVLQKGAEPKELFQLIWLLPQTYRIDKILINDPNTGRTFVALYSNLQQIDSLSLPMKARFDITAEKKATINLEYSKVTVNTPQTFPFSIPESYEQKQ